MVNRNLIRDLEDADLRALFEAETAIVAQGESALATIESEIDFKVNTIVDGRVLRIDDASGSLATWSFPSSPTPPPPATSRRNVQIRRSGSPFPTKNRATSTTGARPSPFESPRVFSPPILIRDIRTKNADIIFSRAVKL